YSSIRMWGSLGFVLLVALLGALFEQHGVSSFPYIVCGLLLGIWLFSLITPEATGVIHHEDSPAFSTIVKQPVVIIFFVLVFLLQASHGPYYAFYSIYLDNNGYTRTLIGQFWALGVIAEIIIFLVMHKLMKLWRAEMLLFISLILTSVRWLLIASFVDSFSIMFIAQLFHAASFGIFHAASIHLVHRYFPSNAQGRGQALYSSLSFGAGGAIGALYSGMTWESLGPGWTYNIAAMLSGLAVLIALLYLRLSNKNMDLKS
ncbi:MAG: MFS transporter, partial [Gammaproteobacteria bacterium]|nr:MFS transporter [Gammaproteobacteria bacterium]